MRSDLISTLLITFTQYPIKKKSKYSSRKVPDINNLITEAHIKTHKKERISVLLNFLYATINMVVSNKSSKIPGIYPNEKTSSK